MYKHPGVHIEHVRSGPPATHRLKDTQPYTAVEGKRGQSHPTLAFRENTK
jgi:hypothetical protein